MHKYVKEIQTVVVNDKPIGFMARRAISMGVHDGGDKWAYGVIEKSGTIKFRGAYRKKTNARLALMEHLGVKDD